jgi:hypothetical protein
MSDNDDGVNPKLAMQEGGSQSGHRIFDQSSAMKRI